MSYLDRLAAALDEQNIPNRLDLASQRYHDEDDDFGDCIGIDDAAATVWFNERGEMFVDCWKDDYVLADSTILRGIAIAVRVREEGGAG